MKKLNSSILIIIVLAAIGLFLIFKNQLFLGSVYDLGGAVPDECGNLYANVSDRPFWSSATNPDFWITGTNYVGTYDRCSVKACISKANLAMTSSTNRAMVYNFGPFKWAASYSSSLSNSRCVWSGNLYYNNQVIQSYSSVPSPSVKLYLANDGSMNSTSPDYYFTSSGFSTSGSRCDEVNFAVTYLKPAVMPCTYGTTVQTSGTNQVYCKGASNGISGLSPYQTTMSYDVIFIKKDNVLPCIVQRQAPVTQRSENFALTDGSSIIRTVVEGEIITLQPGEEKQVMMFVNIGALAREQPYEIQIGATAKGDEGELADEYQWYKE